MQHDIDKQILAAMGDANNLWTMMAGHSPPMRMAILCDLVSRHLREYPGDSARLNAMRHMAMEALETVSMGELGTAH